MLNLEAVGQVHLAPGATDLRKSIDGLAGLVRVAFNLDPFSDQWFVFCNRQRDKLKILKWDLCQALHYVEQPPGLIGLGSGSARRFEQAVRIKLHLIPQHKIAGPAQLAGQGFQTQHPVSPLALAFHEGLGLGVLPAGKMRRFHVCPAQIPVPALPVGFPLLFPVAHLPAFHHPAIGQIVAFLGKPFDPSTFQQDGPRQHFPDPPHCLQPLGCTR
jgi:hypothetical protein